MEHIPINPTITECIAKIKNGENTLTELPIIFTDSNIKFFQVNSVFVYIPNITPMMYIAAFDLDWTLSYAEKHLYPKEPNDIFIIPNRRNVLVNIIKKGYTLVLFTNQYSKSKKEKEKRVQRIKTFIEKIKLPFITFIAIEKDEYRKPEIGMYNLLIDILLKKGIILKKIIYIGDALGRPQDFSDSDMIFGKKIGAKVYSPEQIFPESEIPPFKPTKELVVFVGMPGSGKSKYYKDYLSDHIYINQDILGSKANVFKKLRESFNDANYTSIVIDSTNPNQKLREEYYSLAQQHNYCIKVLYFIRNGYGWNKLRKNPVPTMVYHIYFKKLEPPTIQNTPGNIYYIV